jgi:hypothetical protein
MLRNSSLGGVVVVAAGHKNTVLLALFVVFGCEFGVVRTCSLHSNGSGRARYS